MRDDGIKKAGISRWRYRELRAFCRQYDEKRANALRLKGALCRVKDGVCISTGEAADLTAARSEKLFRDCRMIEKAAREADPAGGTAIFKNAAQGLRYEETGFYGDRATFFRLRERFFIELDRNLRERDMEAG